MEDLLRLEHVSKSFGEVRALVDVSLTVGKGEAVGLLGDNGAGKSTLIKIATGYIQCDPGGEIYWKGERLKKLTVSRGRDLGIETVYQEHALADQQSIWRNIFIGREITNRCGFLATKKMRRETQNLLDHIGFTSEAVRPSNVVRTLSGGERRGIAIARALYFEAELVILDEPTMGLSLSETRKTLDFIRGIKDTGKSCIFIDHNVFHVYPVVDRIVVLDRGRVAGQFKKDELTMDELMEQLYLVARTGSMRRRDS